MRLPVSTSGLEPGKAWFRDKRDNHCTTMADFGPNHVLVQNYLKKDKSRPFNPTSTPKYPQFSIANKTDKNEAAHKPLCRFLCIVCLFSLLTLIDFSALSPQAALAVLTKPVQTSIFNCICKDCIYSTRPMHYFGITVLQKASA